MGRSVGMQFEHFAETFVRVYWETFKNNTFPMPPNEPVEETLEELLADVSHDTVLQANSDRERPLHLLRMTSTHGAWWHFTFRNKASAWQLVGASAPSANETPHDLLGPVYSEYFAPFLGHVTEVANQKTS